MLGLLNTTCEYQPQGTINAYGEPTLSDPITLPCGKNTSTTLKQTSEGLISSQVTSYILHNEVMSGDYIDGFRVEVETVRDLRGKPLYFKAVVTSE